jgi:NAD-reducing hydrogenase small subunit
LERVRPVHEVVKVDLFVPGCPPPADAIYFVVSELLAGRMPNPATVTRFGL